MKHENCSDLLNAYVKDALHPDIAAEVEEHLASCPECRLEEAGVRAIRSAEVEPMTDLERATLHRELRTQIKLPERPTRESRTAWLPSAIAAAALLLAVVVGVRFLGGVGGGGDEGGDSAGGQQQLADGPRPQTIRLVPAHELQAGGSLSGAEGAGSGDAASAPDAASPEQGGAAPDVEGPRNQERQEAVDESESEAVIIGARARAVRRLTSFAQRSDAFADFAAAYSVEDIAELQDDFLAQLAADAPDVAAAQVVECADRVLQAQTYAMLPVVAGHGRFEQEPALLLGFAWSQNTAGPLDRYWLFVWPRGRCDIPLHSQTGEVEP